MLKVLFLILMQMFSAWNPKRAVANLLLWNTVIGRVKQCLFKQSLHGLVNSQWHLKAFVDTAVLIWKEWLPINRILKWAKERQKFLGCERSDSHESGLVRVSKLSAFFLPLSDASFKDDTSNINTSSASVGKFGPLALSPALNQRQERLQKCLYSCIHVKIK